MGSAATPTIDYVDGDLTLTGIDERLRHSGRHRHAEFRQLHWHGIVLVVGDGHMDFDGGGNGQINGTVFVAKIWDDYTTKNLLTISALPISTGTVVAATVFITITAGWRT